MHRQYVVSDISDGAGHVLGTLPEDDQHLCLRSQRFQQPRRDCRPESRIRNVPGFLVLHSLHKGHGCGRCVRCRDKLWREPCSATANHHQRLLGIVATLRLGAHPRRRLWLRHDDRRLEHRPSNGGNPAVNQPSGSGTWSPYPETMLSNIPTMWLDCGNVQPLMYTNLNLRADEPQRAEHLPLLPGAARLRGAGDPAK